MTDQGDMTRFHNILHYLRNHMHTYAHTCTKARTSSLYENMDRWKAALFKYTPIISKVFFKSLCASVFTSYFHLYDLKKFEKFNLK